ncbi:hypothetical protein HYC85_009011 [Camellia sinensis]|uniref:Glycoside hydrolase family 3 N-terminal domain-containing protein n=1 Tax=Camellia sinensis TaxID=4442 RepID=A0A7J7HUI3_CAMSI|nr:hypothetical protein HYC85_009011 [Camellia sinensis]
MIDRFQNAALESRLGIPLLYGTDAVHGNNNVYGATVFPHNIGLGATRCLAAKGEESSECHRFAKYYRSLCLGEWVSAIAVKITFFLVCFDLAISSSMFGCIMVNRLNELYFVLFAQMMN